MQKTTKGVMLDEGEGECVLKVMEKEGRNGQVMFEDNEDDGVEREDNAQGDKSSND